jgi:hypothetical protein
MRLAPKHSRSSNESRGRHECLHQRGAKGKIDTGYGRSYCVVAESGLLLKSTITEQELFVTLVRPRLAPVAMPI